MNVGKMDHKSIKGGAYMALKNSLHTNARSGPISPSSDPSVLSKNRPIAPL